MRFTSWIGSIQATVRAPCENLVRNGLLRLQRIPNTNRLLRRQRHRVLLTVVVPLGICIAPAQQIWKGQCSRLRGRNRLILITVLQRFILLVRVHAVRVGWHWQRLVGQREGSACVALNVVDFLTASVDC